MPNSAVKPLILVVEDDPAVRNLIVAALEAHGLRHMAVETAHAAIAAASSQTPSIVLLDLGLPDMDGVKVVESVRAWSGMPIIVVSARSEDADKIRALDAGADDYLTKPFRPTVLLMRVKSLLRRVEMERGGDPTDRDITVGDLRFSGDEKQLFCREKPLALSPNELKMLLFLMRGEGKAFSRDELLNHIWGYNDEVETRVTDETLRRIRSKLSSADSKVQIETVWGYGYRLRSDGGGK